MVQQMGANAVAFIAVLRKLAEPSELDRLLDRKVISITCGSKVNVPRIKLRWFYAI